MGERMTPAELVAAEALAKAARAAFDDEVEGIALIGNGKPGNGTTIRYDFERGGGFAVYDFTEAAARSMVPRLVAEVRARDTAIEAVRELHVRQRRPKVAECSCGLIVCSTLRALEGATDDMA